MSQITNEILCHLKYLFNLHIIYFSHVHIIIEMSRYFKQIANALVSFMLDYIAFICLLFHPLSIAYVMLIKMYCIGSVKFSCHHKHLEM